MDDLEAELLGVAGAQEKKKPRKRKQAPKPKVRPPPPICHTCPSPPLPSPPLPSPPLPSPPRAAPPPPPGGRVLSRPGSAARRSGEILPSLGAARGG